MIALLRLTFIHVMRSRLLIALLIFTFVVQLLGVRLLHSMTLVWQGIISSLDFRDVLFVALLFQLGSGGFLAAAYGLWIAPYLHRGHREQLTFCLPVGKWIFPVAHASMLFGLALLQHVILMISFAVNFGWGVFLKSDFPWAGTVSGFFLELIAFEFAMFAFGVGALVLGVIPSLFLGVVSVFVLQGLAAVVRFKLDRYFLPWGGDGDTWLGVLNRWAPPFGELAYDLRKIFVKPVADWSVFGLWAIWLLVAMGGFWFLVTRPRLSRSSDA